MKPIEKIETLFERDGNFVVTDTIKRPVLATISQWRATEKVDGTSMRIGWLLDFDDTYSVPNASNNADPDVWSFVAGKSDNASTPSPLAAHCWNIADRGASLAKQVMQDFGLSSFTLYGEGYGGKIQSGGKYRTDQGFILFDVRANDIYLDDDKVSCYAVDFDVPRAPDLGLMSLPEMVDLVKEGFASQCSATVQPAEGIVARPIEPLYDARGKRVMIKLKTKDWAPANPKPDRRA